MSPFEIIVEMLRIASSPATISTIEYHNMVNILRHYDTHRQSPQEEQEILARVGWPLTYHPCDHMENIRWACVFSGRVEEGCPAIAALCQEYEHKFI